MFVTIPDDVCMYHPFCDDFGPFNLGNVCRCRSCGYLSLFMGTDCAKYQVLRISGQPTAGKQLTEAGRVLFR